MEPKSSEYLRLRAEIIDLLVEIGVLYKIDDIAGFWVAGATGEPIWQSVYDLLDRKMND